MADNLANGFFQMMGTKFFLGNNVKLYTFFHTLQNKYVLDFFLAIPLLVCLQSVSALSAQLAQDFS